MDDTDDASAGRGPGGTALGFAAVAVLAAVDLASDADGLGSIRHVALEGALLLVGLVGLVAAIARLRALARETGRLTRESADLAARLAESRAAAESFRAEAAHLVDGLGAAIDAQLGRWGLSPAEKEVAMLLLKGLSHKEIATARGVAEATVRKQAQSLYGKAGLAGRADLAAFFLEDLLAPRDRGPGAP